VGERCPNEANMSNSKTRTNGGLQEMGYAKLFDNITLSSVWAERDPIRIVWITLLALKNENGVIEASVPGLANLARVSLEDCVEALQKFESPDPYSRNPENEGRRIEKIAGGWVVLNHELYRRKLSPQEKREQREHIRSLAAERQARWRERKAEKERIAEELEARRAKPEQKPQEEMFPTPAQLLANKWMQTIPAYKLHPERAAADLTKWAHSLELCVSRDKRTWEQVEKVVDWVMKDRIELKTKTFVNGKLPWQGWWAVIQSPMKLRHKNRDKVQYFTIILDKIESGAQPVTKMKLRGPATNPEDWVGQKDVDSDEGKNIEMPDLPDIPW
jgi:hypothetical protein